MKRAWRLIMHSAKLENSKRLQRVYNLLKSGHAYTTLQIQRAARVCAVNSIVSEIRDNGYDITCRCIGRGLFIYQMQK